MFRNNINNIHNVVYVIRTLVHKTEAAKSHLTFIDCIIYTGAVKEARCLSLLAHCHNSLFIDTLSNQLILLQFFTRHLSLISF